MLHYMQEHYVAILKGAAEDTTDAQELELGGMALNIYSVIPLCNRKYIAKTFQEYSKNKGPGPSRMVTTKRSLRGRRRLCFRSHPGCGEQSPIAALHTEGGREGRRIKWTRARKRYLTCTWLLVSSFSVCGRRKVCKEHTLFVRGESRVCSCLITHT